MKIAPSRRELGSRTSALLALTMGLGLVFQTLVVSPANAVPKPPPVKVRSVEDGSKHVQKTSLATKERPPMSASKDALRRDYDEPQTA